MYIYIYILYVYVYIYIYIYTHNTHTYIHKYQLGHQGDLTANDECDLMKRECMARNSEHHAMLG